MDEIKIGSKVEYTNGITKETKQGEVVEILVIEDSYSKSRINKKVCNINYDCRCEMDRVFIEQLKLVN